MGLLISKKAHQPLSSQATRGLVAQMPGRPGSDATAAHATTRGQKEDDIAWKAAALDLEIEKFLEVDCWNEQHGLDQVNVDELMAEESREQENHAAGMVVRKSQASEIANSVERLVSHAQVLTSDLESEVIRPLREMSKNYEKIHKDLESAPP